MTPYSWLMAAVGVMATVAPSGEWERNTSPSKVFTGTLENGTEDMFMGGPGG